MPEIFESDKTRPEVFEGLEVSETTGRTAADDYRAKTRAAGTKPNAEWSRFLSAFEV